MITRRSLLLATLGRQRDARRKAIGWLWREQSVDGGWHSRTYGLLRSGQSLTPLVLLALLEADSELPTSRVRKAVDFLRRHIDPHGALGRAQSELPDYPNYATSLAVIALHKLGQCDAKMIEYLLGQQFTEDNGWERDHPVYGAWGMGGDRVHPPHTGHVDLSMTRHVLEALTTQLPSDHPCFAKARIFLKRCQNPDGGFFFSTVIDEANKAGHDGRGWRSYGTATVDGILASIAAGAETDSAARWLRTHHQYREVPGFHGEAYARFRAGLRYYYTASSARALRAIGMIPKWREALGATQRPDGSWRNPETLVKEDDPLIATALALRALSA